MQVSDFDFMLPDALIARYPLPERTKSRLLIADQVLDRISHASFLDLPSLLKPHDLLVLNDTRVMPARLFAFKASQGKVEILVERIIDEHQALAHIKTNKSIKVQTTFYLDDKIEITVLSRQDNLFLISFHSELPVFSLLKQYGHIPLPPYMKRADELSDQTRYQTVYAKEDGAIAAPTAGLHFDEHLLQQLRTKGIQIAFVTLHVGAGTFQPVRVASVADHKMHSEYMNLSQTICDQVLAARQQGGRVIAVGTTAVRCLETASMHGSIAPYTGETRLFVYPGYTFRSTDLLITNFHLPKSTLLMLVSAFSSWSMIKKAYDLAVLE
ncbi:MAG: tRNA preQ1(34) S-adenosylmethionine ribosyltransferase-isomerase QueA, partial [Endozoicomonadaceae bacterium]|nr:tRNA preQ1(34) S-adenosylmethionine ribosyltransferase-isomerase QueA [Endozoicomonadaceae bacterium]